MECFLSNTFEIKSKEEENPQAELKEEKNYFYIEGEEDDLLTYSLDEDPDSILTTQEFISITISPFSHFCYEDLEELHSRTLFFYINSKIPITYRFAFKEINRQFRQQMKEIIVDINKKYQQRFTINNFMCDHKFLESLDMKTPIQYDIYCGS